MTKLSLAGASLAAAIPGALLAFLIGSSLVGQFSDMPMMVSVFAGLALLVAAVAVLIPPGIMVFGPKSAAEAKEKKKEAAADESTEAGSDLREAEEEDAAGVTLDSGEEEAFEAGDLSAESVETVDFEDDAGLFDEEDERTSG